MNRFKKEFRIIDMCRVFDVSRSGYYAWLKRRLSSRDREELEVVKPAVRKAFEDSRQTYGCVRVSRELIRQSIPLSAKCAARIMREDRMIPKAALRLKGLQIVPMVKLPHRIWLTGTLPVMLPVSSGHLISLRYQRRRDGFTWWIFF